MKTKQTQIRRQFLPPLAMALLILLAALTTSNYHMGRQRVVKEYQNTVDGLEKLFTLRVEDEEGHFKKLADFICSDTAIQQAYKSGDRQRLLKTVEPVFEQVCAIKSISHFYFHRPDRTCFLRVHKPDRYDDFIERQTLATAVETGQPASGLEFGPLGSLALRWVYPWRVDGELIGYLELSEDIGTINQRLSQQPEMDIVTVIDKAFLSRQAWQERVRAGAAGFEWDDCSRHVIGDSTLGAIPPAIRTYIHKTDSDNSIDKAIAKLTISERSYLVRSFPIQDAAGRVVGKRFVFGDITAPMLMVSRSMLITFIIAAIAGQCIYIFSFLFLEGIERRLQETDLEQRKEIAGRRFAEAQLNEARLRIEKAYTDLRKTQEKLQLHIEYTPLGVIQWSTQFTVESWNPAAELIFGYTAEEAIGRTAKDLIIPEDLRPDMQKLFSELLDATEPSTNENENITRDGRRIMCQWHNTPLIDDSGKVIGVSSIVEDITKELEYEHCLREAKEKAEGANASKSMFLANITHELRTPMNAILGFSDLLRNEELNEEQLDYAETIYSSGRHLLTLINDVLDISKMEAGKLDIVNDHCSIRPLLQQLRSMMQPVADQRNLDFEVITSDSIPAEIITDAKRLHQCLVNLIGNAIKFTEQGSVTLRAGLLDSDANPWLYFEVRDTGIGIPPDRLDKIFESFEQADSDTSVRYGGTGLGLAITRQLAEHMGGTLTVESEVGVGSVFTITLPLEPVTEPAPQSVS